MPKSFIRRFILFYKNIEIFFKKIRFNENPVTIPINFTKSFYLSQFFSNMQKFI